LMFSVVLCSFVMIGLFFTQMPGVSEFFTPTMPLSH